MTTSSNLPIKNWSIDDRPREKLLLKGKHVLSNAELLAILIGSGSRGESAVELCKRILQTYNNELKELSRKNVKELSVFKGIGEAKAVTLVAALELANRLPSAALKERPKITSSLDVFQVMHSVVGSLPHEEFWVLLLNNNNNVIFKFQISKGGLTQTIVDVRMVFKTALEHLATSLILVHNHPSGQLQPSKADLDITEKIKQAGLLLDIKLLDHVIVTADHYFSFLDECKL